MASKEQVKEFINTIGTLAQNEYLARDRWVLPSLCIAQAALESGWNLNASTLFGIKYTGQGEAFTASTSEYYNDHYEEIQAAFQSYPNVTAAVKGYYDLLTKVSYYSEAVNNADYKSAIMGIDDGVNDDCDGIDMYATDPDYQDKIIAIIEQNNLTEWDGIPVIATPVASYDEIPAHEGESYNKGDRVRVLNAIQYTGGSFVAWHDVYDVIDVNGDRIVIGVDGVVTAAINARNIALVESGAPQESAQAEERTVTVQAGNSFWQIANDYMGDGNRMQELAEFNNMTLDTMLYAGMVLRLPN